MNARNYYEDMDRLISSFLEKTPVVSEEAESHSGDEVFFQRNVNGMHSEGKERVAMPTQIQENQYSPEPQVDQLLQLTSSKEALLPQICPAHFQKRALSVIESTRDVAEEYAETLKGDRFQTHNLGWHFYRETLSFLSVLKSSRLLGKEQDLLLKEFILHKGTVQSFHNLFQNPNIRSRCLFFYSSEFILREILQSTRMELKKKLTMIKYLEKMRLMIICKGKGWKR